jgi:hypothetical protein
MSDDPRSIRFGLFARFAVLLAIAVIYKASTGPYYGTYEVADIIATVIFILLLSWCLTPSLRLDNGGLEEPGNSLALRLGKATKRGLRFLKRLF